MFSKIRNAVLALAAVATLGIGDPRQQPPIRPMPVASGGGGFSRGGGCVGGGNRRRPPHRPASDLGGRVHIGHRPHPIHRPSHPHRASPPALPCRNWCLPLASPLPHPRALAASGASCTAPVVATTYAVAPAPLPARPLHLPDQGIHAGRPGCVQGRVHEGSRLGSGRQHPDAAPAAAAAGAAHAAAVSSTNVELMENPGSGRGFSFLKFASVDVVSRARVSFRHHAARGENEEQPGQHGADTERRASDPFVSGSARRETGSTSRRRARPGRTPPTCRWSRARRCGEAGQGSRWRAARTARRAATRRHPRRRPRNSAAPARRPRARRSCRRNADPASAHARPLPAAGR